MISANSAEAARGRALLPKLLVEDFARLDVRELSRRGVLVEGRHSWRLDDEAVTVIAHEDLLELRDETGDPLCEIELTTTPSAVGGSRTWMLCPGLCCGRRVAVVYFDGRRFGCRTCLRLAYSSQRRRPVERAKERSDAIRIRLGGRPCVVERFPPRPPGMHRRTYERLRGEEAANMKVIADFIEAKTLDFSRLTAKIGRLASAW